MKHYKASLWLFIIFGILLVSVSCSGISNKTAETPEPVASDNIAPIVSATGVVKPAKWSKLSMSVTGLVEEILVEEGDIVEAGQVLIRLEGREELLTAELAAQTAVISATQTLDALYENNELRKAALLKTIADSGDAARQARYHLDNYLLPSTLKGLSSIEAVEVSKEKYIQAWAAYEPYMNEPFNNEKRKDLKEDMEMAQSDYNQAVRHLNYEVELNQAEAAFEKAQADYEKVKDGPDPDDLTLTNALLDQANANLSATKAALADLEFKAPFAGVISEITVRIGEWISPGIPVIAMADLKHLRVETTDLNEIDVARVDVGDHVEVTFDALPDVVVQGEVTHVSPKASEGSGVNYTVIIELTEIPDQLRWGMTAFVDIEISE
ncbi:MAG: efflux RND transporter periplasmic adaptor subunit [Anaerolineales bacterium]|nr:efflux RND transporter periplasmic adaptor subunit [Anaerolineales bacterium]